VFDKAEGYWQVFTISNGFNLMSKVLDTHDYKDYFAIVAQSADRSAPWQLTMNVSEDSIRFGTSDDQRPDFSTIVIIFNKKSHRIFSLSVPEYERFVKDKKRVDFKDESFSWYFDKKYPYPIIKEDKNTGAKSYYSYTVNKRNISTTLHRHEGKVFAMSENMIRIFDNDRNETQLTSANGLYTNGLTNLTIGDEIIATYGNVVQILDPVDYHQTEIIKLAHKPDNILKLNNHYYYSVGPDFYIYDRENDSSLLKATFSFSINNLSFTAPNVMIYTEVGYSRLNIETGEMEHFFENATGYSEAEGYVNGLWVLGELENHVLAYTKHYDYSLEGFKISAFKISKATDSITEVYINDTIKKTLGNPRSTQIIDQRLIIASSLQFDIYEIINTDDFSLRHEFSYQITSENPEAIPNSFKWESDEPVGGEFLDITLNKDQVWVSTYSGLFCYDMDNENWSCHVLSSARVHSGNQMIITDESIYSNGYGNAFKAGPWSRINRKDYSFRYFYHRSVYTYFTSYKKNSSEIISAGPKGMYIYNYQTDQIRVIPTPRPIRQVCFDEQGYLAANAHRIYQINTQGKVDTLYTFTKPFKEEKFSKSPGLLEKKDNTLWLVSNHLHSDMFLTRLNSKTWNKTSYFLKNDAIRIFPGGSITWIIGKKYLYKYDEKRDKLFSGIMVDADGQPVYTNTFKDALLHQGKLIVLDRKAIYAIDLETMQLLENKRHTHKSYPPVCIRYYDHKIFMSSGVGIYQYDEQKFLDEFIPSENLRYPKQDQWQEVLPFNPRDTIHLNTSGRETKIFFSLENELSGIIIDKIRPNTNLYATLGLDDIRIGCGVFSSNHLENIYEITLTGIEFDENEALLKVYFTDNKGSTMLVRKWVVEK
jgi:hypothetical protein